MSLPGHFSGMHRNCVGGSYPGGPVRGASAAVDWATPDAAYSPVAYTAASVLQEPPWADLLFPMARWNAVDGPVNRASFMGQYNIVGHLPQNPRGRTGIEGRGLLGRYGPNHTTGLIFSAAGSAKPPFSQTRL